MKDNIVENKVEFNKNDFIELFLYDLIIRGINKINIFELKYDLAEFYNIASVCNRTTRITVLRP